MDWTSSWTAKLSIFFPSFSYVKSNTNLPRGGG